MKLKRIFYFIFIILLIVFISCTTNPQSQETNTIFPSQDQPTGLKNSDELSYAIEEDTLIIYSDQGMENWVYFFRDVKKSDPAAYENIIQTIHHVHMNEGITMIPESAFENMENVMMK